MEEPQNRVQVSNTPPGHQANKVTSLLAYSVVFERNEVHKIFVSSQSHTLNLANQDQLTSPWRRLILIDTIYSVHFPATIIYLFNLETPISNTTLKLLTRLTAAETFLLKSLDYNFSEISHFTNSVEP